MINLGKQFSTSIYALVRVSLKGQTVKITSFVYSGHIVMPLVPVRLATGRTKYVRFQHFLPRIEHLSSRTRVCVLRACASRPHVSGHPNSPTHKEMMNDWATASADGTTCDAEDKNINMMWCSGCGGEGVISTLSKKQKRARD